MDREQRMLFERKGGAPNLEKDFAWFVKNHLHGRSLDDNRDAEAAQGKFPDFSCLRGLLLLEMKALKEDQGDRVNEVFDKLADPTEKPVFYGKRDSSKILGSLSNGKEIEQKVFDKLTSTISNHLSKADKQFANYRLRTKRKNSVTICVILNSTVMEFSPQTVAAVIQRKMNVIPKAGLPKYYNIDAVVYISEKHVTKLDDNRNAFALVVFHAAGAVEQPWKMQLIDYFAKKWSEERTEGEFEGTIKQPFTAVEDVPDRISRGDAVRLAYKRNPYMRHLTDAELRVCWNRSVALSILSFVKGDWEPLADEERIANTDLYSCLNEELNFRGIDLRSMSFQLLTPEQQAEALRGLPSQIAADMR